MSELPRIPEIPGPFRPEHPSTPAPSRPSTLWSPASTGVPGLDERLMDQRLVFARGVLDSEAATALSARLMTLDAMSGKPIHLRMSTPGAEPLAALALIDTLDALRAEVHATASGQVGGPALAVLASAHRRFATPHATLAFFEPRSEVSGTATEIAAEAERAEQALTALYQRLAEVTGKSMAAIREDARAGRFMTAQQAVGYGLVEEPGPEHD